MNFLFPHGFFEFIPTAAFFILRAVFFILQLSFAFLMLVAFSNQNPKFGWAVVETYERDDLASDGEDDRWLIKVERTAERKLKKG